MELVERLVREFRVAVIPGTTFGLNEGCYLRVSYGALTEETAAEGIRRLVKGLRTILGPKGARHDHADDDGQDGAGDGGGVGHRQGGRAGLRWPKAPR